MLKIDVQQVQDSYGVLKQVANTGFIEATNQLAHVLVPEQGSNELMDELLTRCREVQANYNEQFLPGVNGLLQTYNEVVDIGEYLQKQASVGDVAKVDTGFTSGTVSAADVKM